MTASNPVVMASKGAWKELFTNPQYRGRTWVLIVVWMLGYAGLIYGVGAFPRSTWWTTAPPRISCS